MRELGCKPYLEESNVELRVNGFIELRNIIDRIKVVKDPRGNCATHLLSNKARPW
jgi:hypothetical protein